MTHSNRLSLLLPNFQQSSRITDEMIQLYIQEQEGESVMDGSRDLELTSLELLDFQSRVD